MMSQQNLPFKRWKSERECCNAARKRLSVHERVCYVDLIRVLLTNAHDHDIQFSDAS